MATKDDFERILPGLKNMDKLPLMCSEIGNLINQTNLKDHEKKVVNKIIQDTQGCISKSGVPDSIKLHELKQQVKTMFNIDDKNS